MAATVANLRSEVAIRKATSEKGLTAAETEFVADSWKKEFNWFARGAYSRFGENLPKVSLEVTRTSDSTTRNSTKGPI